MFPPIEQALERITGATTLDELKAVLARVPLEYDLTLIFYHPTRWPNMSATAPQLLLSSDDGLAKQYLELDIGAGANSQGGHSGFLPFEWDELAPRAREAGAFTPEAGARGMTIPIRGPSGEHACMSIASDVTPDAWASLRMIYMRDFLIIAHFIHDQAVRLTGSRPQGLERMLSARERETLQLAARGFSPKQIAADLHLSSTAVRLYLQRARTKLECASLTQLIARAVSLDIIQA